MSHGFLYFCIFIFLYCFKKSSYCSALEETMHNHILNFISYCLYAGIVLILGGGPNRIGQGIEFDYCCCHASFVLQVHSSLFSHFA
jgi:hypothetical protein